MSSHTELEAFQALVRADGALQAQLRATVDPAAFLRLVVALGAAHGYRFTVDDVRAALQASRSAWFAQRSVR